MDAITLRQIFGSLYDDTPDAVVLYDTAGKVVVANRAACSLIGYAEHEMIGSSYESQVASSDIPRVRAAVETALAGGADHFETTIRSKSSDVVPVECYVFAAHLNGEVAGIFCQARDILALRSAEESLGFNQQRFRSLFEYHPDGIMELKETGDISRVNVALESETGFYGEHLVGKSWIELVAPECREAAADALRSAMRGEAIEQDSLLLDRLGNRIDVALKLVPVHAGDAILGAYAIFRSVTAQKTAERAMETQSEQIRRLYLVAAARGGSIDDQIDATLALGLELFGFDHAYVANFQGDRVLIRNSVGAEGATQRGMNYPAGLTMARHLAGERRLLCIADMDDAEWRDDPAREISRWRAFFGVQLSVGDGIFGALVFASRAQRPEGVDQRERDLMQMMGLFVAAALERTQQNDRIEQMAFTDSLTGLPNRVLFKDRIEHTLATAKRYTRGFAVMYADLDNFKAINDRFGHAVGDAVLKAVAGRLREMLRESDTVARFGGDEFVILQPIVDGPSDAADLARKINVVMQPPVAVEGATHSVHMSMGIALYPSDATSIEGLMEEADRALYRAKHEGRNRWCFANAESARRELKKPTHLRATEK